MASRDDLEGITKDFGLLSITREPELNGDLSPISEIGESDKRARVGADPFSRYRTTTGTILDPLLFLRVHQASDSVSESTAVTSIDPPSLEEIFSENLVRSERHKEKRESAQSRGRGSAHQKTKPLATPSVKLPIAVFRFCQENEVNYIAHSFTRTYRSIAFSRSSASTAEFDPWEQFIELNSLAHYRLCHAVYLGFRSQDEEGRLVALVPHHSKKSGIVDVEKLSAVLDAEVFRVSLTQMEKELGFPTFVCPPFGHEYAPKMHANESRPKFKTVIDSSLVLEAQTDCVFEMGAVGIRLRTAELNSLASSKAGDWTVIENLVRRS